ncbi:methyltransferase domain-containing protein [Chlorogloeopsis sp. ULAP01]|uniref:methyltransferase domain-containing protein n=1 Tax=Chlorogloeopsis sp. ULAP01 TaxID=3056483 RepID=UPI0025AA5478|nr:methyltransferase domain-containing protein [Chlorogloeopsis sp. ULAP01]MDM9380819.1 methyltransferase domain-containing protein [Chlorogloeopsis sp. ULAP01]
MNTSKATEKAMPIDKLACQHYLRNYEEYLKPLRDQEIVLLELGVAEGKSLLYWRDFFPKAQIIGLDIHPVQINDPSNRIKVYQGEQQNREVLNKIADEVAPNGFDVIVDDASHIGQFTRISFWHLFENYLKPGGLYFIEDWGCSYWDIYPDGKKYFPQQVDFTWYEKLLNHLLKISFIQNTTLFRKLVNKLRIVLVKKEFPSHQRGMVGFVKELVDECGFPDITNELFGNPPKRPSMIEWMRVSVGHVVIKKAAQK